LYYQRSFRINIEKSRLTFKMMSPAKDTLWKICLKVKSS